MNTNAGSMSRDALELVRALNMVSRATMEQTRAIQEQNVLIKKTNELTKKLVEVQTPNEISVVYPND